MIFLSPISLLFPFFLPLPIFSLLLLRKKPPIHIAIVIVVIIANINIIIKDGGEWSKGLGRRIIAISSRLRAAIGAAITTAKSLRVTETKRLEHLWTVLEESKAPGFACPVQLRPCARIPPISRPVWED